MAESDAVQKNLDVNARAAARSRSQNSNNDPASAVPELDNLSIAEVANGTAAPSMPATDATISWGGGDIREVQQPGDVPLSSDLRRVAGVSGTPMKAEHPDDFGPQPITRNQRANPSGVDEIVNWNPRGK
jgi:hypothetical protein